MYKKAVILVSGTGSNMESIIKACKESVLHLKIERVFSNRSNPPAFEKATKYKIPTEFLSSKLDRLEERLSEYIHKNQIDLIILAGFMRILSPNFTARFKRMIVNIHPALLPAFPGLDAQRRAWDTGVAKTGVTVHFVDEGVDTGEIILQREFIIDRTKSFEFFKNELLKLEHRTYIEALQSLDKK